MSNLNEEDIAKINESAKEREMTVELENVQISEETGDFIENNPMTKTTVARDLWEWSNLITELSIKETEYIKIKERIFDKEQWMTENTDFKGMYGKNNIDIRKAHFKKFLVDEYAAKNDLEISIDYINRRISYLKSLIRVKSVIMEVKE